MTDGLSGQSLNVAVRSLLVDRLTAEIATLFADAGIACMLVKGPVIGGWLYEDGLRSYNDSDLLVPWSRWDAASEVLTTHGFHDYLSAVAHPSIGSAASKGFVRGLDNLDLHCTLDGLDAPPQAVWDAFWSTARRQQVGGRSVAVPAKGAVLMHLALHAAHHHDEPKPVEDLRRGILHATTDEWREAAALAHRLEGLAAFATGLRRLPEGEQLASELGVGDAGSVHFDLRSSGVPTAEGLHELLEPGLTFGQRASRAASELFPKPSFMRWWTPLARRGALGLIASYPVRWGWLAMKLPAGFIELGRARRRRGTAPDVQPQARVVPDAESVFRRDPEDARS
jgi:putative nucleotidyltransferase-like protein